MAFLLSCELVHCDAQWGIVYAVLDVPRAVLLIISCCVRVAMWLLLLLVVKKKKKKKRKQG